MSRRERIRARPDRLATLLETGAHGAAARQAQARLADPDATPEERARAGAALASLAPEPLALVMGAAGVAAAIAIGIWASLGGGR